MVSSSLSSPPDVIADAGSLTVPGCVSRKLQYLSSALVARPLAAMLVLWVLTTSMYLSALGGPLVMDDHAALAPLFEQYLTTPWHQLVWSQTGPAGRPVSMLSFLLSIWLTDTDVEYLKLGNIFLHLLNASVAFFCLKAIFAATSGPAAKHPSLLSLIVVSGWCLNPMHVSTTLYTVQRMTQLAMLFSLGALLTIACAVSATRRSRFVWLFASAICYTLAIFSKENAVLALPITWAYLRVVVTPPYGSFAGRLSNWLGLLTLLLALAIAFNFSYHWNLPHSHETYIARGFTAAERMLTEVRVVVGYAESFLLPSLDRLPFHYDWLPISRSLWSPASTFFCLLAIGIATMWCVFGPRRYAIGRFGAAWFLIGHSLEAGPWPLMIAFEHRNYFPSLGLMTCAVGIASSLPFTKSILSTIFFSWMSLAIMILVLHITNWQSSFSFAYHSYRSHVESPMARSNLAEALAGMGSTQGALAILDTDHSVGSQLQALCHLCAAGMTISDRAERLFQSPITAVDARELAGLRELTRQIIQRSCPIPPHEFASWMQRLLLEAPFVHPVARNDVSTYSTQLYLYGGDKDRAVQAALFPARIAGEFPVRLLLAGDYVYDCSAARSVLAEAGTRESNLGPRSDEFLKDIQVILEQSGCIRP